MVRYEETINEKYKEQRRVAGFIGLAAMYARVSPITEPFFITRPHFLPQSLRVRSARITTHKDMSV